MMNAEYHGASSSDIRNRGCNFHTHSYLRNWIVRMSHVRITLRKESMKRAAYSLALVVLLVAGLPAQQNQTSQTPRQALLEMFFSKTPGTFVKHLPLATQTALEKSGGMTALQQYSLFASQFQAQGQALQTFETGPLLLTGEDPKTGQKVEVNVVSDKLNGDQDDIVLSFQTYKNAQAQRTPFLPQVIFTMKQEAQVWKLNEVSVTIHVPLADPDFLKTITENTKPQTTSGNTNGTFVPKTEAPAPFSDKLVTTAIQQILAAETNYTKNYPAVGYTCALSDLDGFGRGDPNEHQAMLLNSGLASGRKYGFVFTLSGCGTSPAATFHLSVAPSARMAAGRKAFCADQSGLIRSSDDGNAENCFAHGTPVQ
jgi:hypothetical protein